MYADPKTRVFAHSWLIADLAEINGRQKQTILELALQFVAEYDDAWPWKKQGVLIKYLSTSIYES